MTGFVVTNKEYTMRIINRAGTDYTVSSDVCASPHTFREDAEKKRVRYIQLRLAYEDLLRRVDAGVLCPRCIGLGTESDGNTACSICGNSGCVPLEDGTYGTYSSG